MKFAIITHVLHKKQNQEHFAYEPYVREMNLWGEHVDEFILLAPKTLAEINPIEVAYKHPKVKFIEIPAFNITSLKNIIKSIFIVPIIVWRIFSVINKADHIHLRCPGNIGLLGCFVQIFFPNKPKTTKYAGNWDPKSKQPLSYRLQKWMLSNTFLTRNCKVLVYGEWENQSKNIVPFFTASYNESEIVEIQEKNLNNEINFMYVGAFSKGKQPLLSVKAVEKLKSEGFNVKLNMYGFGDEFTTVKEYIVNKSLTNTVFLHGNKSKEDVKQAYKKAHFLLFISKSEGWPKVVAEAMFFGCLPVSSAVSCVPFMLDYGNRGILVESDVNLIVSKIKELVKNQTTYQFKVEEAKKWSQKYTLEKFSNSIQKLLLDE
ncbi:MULTISPECIES: glycosyltransferase [Tenacibaculum]|uniref:glycosyltransferase n=1 Tax=Tenacibaculum TaxID=104267 RepID=UPI001F0A2FBC|nr:MULTISPECIES: glycosyltransferase [Tenacibaculum]MCH3881952.1 glycosyltransferase [Tenacibaculum aquimarinum]MDO6600705.1 glycosyltransferase [Tenacibaculum sp. 1_MG-2023]